MILLQWLANKEAGQIFGNQQIIKKDNGLYVSVIRRAGEDWEIFRIRECFIDVLSPFMRIATIGVEPDEGYPCYAIDVNSFDDPEAISWGSTADSDLYGTGSSGL